jgi:hypothetical protein
MPATPLEESIYLRVRLAAELLVNCSELTRLRPREDKDVIQLELDHSWQVRWSALKHFRHVIPHCAIIKSSDSHV